MKSNGVRPADAAIWSGALSGYSPSGSGGGSGGGQGGDRPASREQQSDHMSFSDLLQRGQAAAPADELEQLTQLLRAGNDNIRSLARNFRPLRSRAVPSLLGMPLETAASKLELAGFRVGNVTQEYNPAVPAGSVVSQAPIPGAMAVQESGVHLNVSKGPPPKPASKHPFLTFLQGR